VGVWQCFWGPFSSKNVFFDEFMNVKSGGPDVECVGALFVLIFQLFGTGKLLTMKRFSKTLPPKRGVYFHFT